MADRTVYEWMRGTTLSIALEVYRDPSDLIVGTEPITVRAKKVQHRNSEPKAADAVAFTLTSEFVAASGSTPAYWALTGAPSALDGLDDGFYALDGTLTVAGIVVPAKTVAILVTPSAL